jgi:hypothetical protein
MAVTDRTVCRATLVCLCALTPALGACGSTRLVDADAHPDAPAASPAFRAAAPAPRGRIGASVRAAQQAYNRETKGFKLHRETDRIAGDPVLLGALARGDTAGAQAEARAQLLSPSNHFDHVTRISVTRGPRVLVNATLNSDGTFVDAPAMHDLALHGRSLGTLLVSIQDVTGFVKLVHRRTLAEIVARGSSGKVRTSLPAAAHIALPQSGSVSVAGRRYTVRSFHEVGWGGEALTVWVLERA